MAVEIKELVIRAVVEYDPKEGAGDTRGRKQILGEEEKADIVQACVKQVMKIMKKQNQR